MITHKTKHLFFAGGFYSRPEFKLGIEINTDSTSTMRTIFGIQLSIPYIGFSCWLWKLKTPKN